MDAKVDIRMQIILKIIFQNCIRLSITLICGWVIDYSLTRSFTGKRRIPTCLMIKYLQHPQHCYSRKYVFHLGISEMNSP